MIPQFPNDTEHEIPEYSDEELAAVLADADEVAWKRRHAAGQSMPQPAPEKHPNQLGADSVRN